MAITRDDARRLAQRSQLCVTDEELDHLAPQLDEIIRGLSHIQEIATQDVPPTQHLSTHVDALHDALVQENIASAFASPGSRGG